MENYHQRYLAEEVAEDHAQGLMTRREALRRLGLMGFSVMGASSLLAACGGDDKETAGPTTTGGSGSTPTTTAGSPGSTEPGETPTTVDVVEPGEIGSPSDPADPGETGSDDLAGTETITYPSGRDTPLTGAWAAAQTPRGAVVVIHENRGLTKHIRSVAARLAKDGYSAIAVDLLSEEGGSAKVGEADAGAALNNAGGDRLAGDVILTLDELARRLPDVGLGVIGFCFGGTTTWRLLGIGDPRVSAAIPFYGTVDADVDFSNNQAAVLGVYAELDDRVNATRDTAKAALEKANVVHELRTFPGVNHAFFNDTGPRYDATQATTAYQAVLDWFHKYLG